MAFRSIGDLSMTHMLQARSHAVKTESARLAQELSTGLKSDTGKAVRHDFSTLSGIERSIAMAESYRTSAVEAGVFMQGAQASLEVIQDDLADITPALVAAAASGHETMAMAAATDAEARFRTAVSSLNQVVAGRSLFAGRATETPALAGAQAIIDALEPLAAAATTAADWQSALDTWFAPGGDFDTVAYTGDSTPISGFLVNERERVAMDVTAQDPVLRDSLKALISVAMLDRTAFASDATQLGAAMETASASALGAQGDLSVLRSTVGAAEAAVASAETQVATEKSALQIARNDLLAADPYETATRFEEANRQLESLYLITSRVSRLKLTDFLR